MSRYLFASEQLSRSITLVSPGSNYRKVTYEQALSRRRGLIFNSVSCPIMSVVSHSGAILIRLYSRLRSNVNLGRITERPYQRRAMARMLDGLTPRHSTMAIDRLGEATPRAKFVYDQRHGDKGWTRRRESTMNEEMKTMDDGL